MSIALLAWPGAVAIGISLGLFGSGGSILTVPVLVYLFGQDEKSAIAGSLAIVGTVAAAGALRHLRGRLIDWYSVVTFGLPGMFGTYFGAWIAAFVPGAVQLSLFAVVMLAAALLMLRPPRLDAGPAGRRAGWKIVLDGLFVGVLTGLVGVGGGFLIVPALVLLGGLPIHRAVATSLVIIALKSFSGLAKYVDVLAAEGLRLEWDVIATVTAFGIAGSIAGSALAGRLPTARLTRYFGVFLVVMGALILVNSAPALLEF
mgnify:CR=1 FL=1|jgi:uncharacterized protein